MARVAREGGAMNPDTVQPRGLRRAGPRCTVRFRVLANPFVAQPHLVSQEVLASDAPSCVNWAMWGRGGTSAKPKDREKVRDERPKVLRSEHLAVESFCL